MLGRKKNQDKPMFEDDDGIIHFWIDGIEYTSDTYSDIPTPNDDGFIPGGRFSIRQGAAGESYRNGRLKGDENEENRKVDHHRSQKMHTENLEAGEAVNSYHQITGKEPAGIGPWGWWKKS